MTAPWGPLRGQSARRQSTSRRLPHLGCSRLEVVLAHPARPCSLGRANAIFQRSCPWRRPCIARMAVGGVRQDIPAEMGAKGQMTSSPGSTRDHFNPLALALLRQPAPLLSGLNARSAERKTTAPTSRQPGHDLGSEVPSQTRRNATRHALSHPPFGVYLRAPLSPTYRRLQTN
jgi:hypothetical protein